MDSLEETELHKRIKLLEDEIQRANGALKEAEDRLTNLEQQKAIAEETPTEVVEHEDVNESHHVCASKS